MFISVIIPTLGRESLKSCLQSLKEQAYPRDRFEVIVVNDGGRTDVSKLVSDYGFQYLSQRHQGPAVARNNGAKMAQGEILAFTDDDCLVPTDWLTKLADGYRRFPEAAGVGGYMEAPQELLAVNPYAAYESYMTHRVYGAGDVEILGGFEVPTGGTNNLTYKKEIFRQLKGFDEGFPYAAGEDADFKKRVCEAGYRLLYLPLKVTHYHNYNLASFIRQNRHRGWGSLYFHRKHGGLFSRFQLVRSLMFVPLILVSDVAFARIGLGVGLLKAVAAAVNYSTQLINYGKYQAL